MNERLPVQEGTPLAILLEAYYRREYENAAAQLIEIYESQVGRKCSNLTKFSGTEVLAMLVLKIRKRSDLLDRLKKMFDEVVPEEQNIIRTVIPELFVPELTGQEMQTYRDLMNHLFEKVNVTNIDELEIFYDANNLPAGSK